MRERFFRFRRTPAFTGCVLFLSVLVLNMIVQGTGNVLSAQSLSTLFSKNTPFVLVTMAHSLLLISGTLDLSSGIQLALVSVVAIMVPQEWGWPVAVGWIMAVFAAIGASALCGLLVAYLRLPAMLASFAVLYMVKGVNLLIMNAPQGNVPKEIYLTYDSQILGFIPFSFFIILAVFLLWVYIKRTKFGKHIYAVGADPRNAFAAGINPAWVQMKAYLIKGFIVGIAGLALTAMTASGNPLQSEDYGMRSLAACIIGGLGFGGWGSMSCAIFGAGFLVIIQNTVYYFFTLLNNIIPGFTVTSYWQTLVSDIILLLGLLMTIVTAKGQRETLKQGLAKQFKRGERYVKP